MSFLRRSLARSEGGDALLGGEGREIGLDIGVEIDGQVESGAGPMELAAGSTGEVDLGRDVVVGGGCVHGEATQLGGLTESSPNATFAPGGCPPAQLFVPPRIPGQRGDFRYRYRGRRPAAGK